MTKTKMSKKDRREQRLRNSQERAGWVKLAFTIVKMVVWLFHIV